MEHLIKAVQATDVKFDDAKGTVTAVIATLGVVDKDGDVTLPGFFGEQDTAIVWAHDRSHLIGKGRIFEDGDEAKFDGAFFLDTIEGREKYLTTKAMGTLQEWSYGFRLKEGGYSFGDHDGRQVRYLQPNPVDKSPGTDVDEVSPVLVGAGEGTRTLAMKSGPSLRGAGRTGRRRSRVAVRTSRPNQDAARRRRQAVGSRSRGETPRGKDQAGRRSGDVRHPCRRTARARPGTRPHRRIRVDP